MRYEDWDILLFPGLYRPGSPGVPIQEFKVACHLIHDAEFGPTNPSIGLPNVCCFIPSLRPGSPFHISIHSWVNEPRVSEFTKSHTKYPNLVKFEARLFIDGRLKAATCLDSHASWPDTYWPRVVTHSADLTKSGKPEPMRFPIFRQELLQHDYWSAADDIGRIKIVISESFPRDSPSMPLERVKNIVAFSFQHAPLDILESSAIAWPNPSMWHRTASRPALTYPSEDPEMHTHSPRRRGDQQCGLSPYSGEIIQNCVTSNHPAFLGHGHGKHIQTDDGGFGYGLAGNGDQFGNVTGRLDWMGNSGAFGGTVPHAFDGSNKNNDLRRHYKSSTDTSMPDYVSMPSQGSRMTDKIDHQFAEGHFYSNDDVYVGNMKAPANTPTLGGVLTEGFDNVPFPSLPRSGPIPADLANSLTNSLLNQPLPMNRHHHAGQLPAMEVKSRKETRCQNQENLPPSTGSSSTSTCGNESHHIRKVSQQMRTPTGASLPAGTFASKVNSPQLMESKKGLETGQRAASVDELRTDMTPEAVLRIISGNSAKGPKRTRNFTPVSAKIFDEGDDPRRDSPRTRIVLPTESAEFSPVE